MKNFVLIICIFFYSDLAFSQTKEGNIWYFRNGAGIDFNGATPVPLTNGQITNGEGTSVQSDQNGNVLFYTNGEEIWNKNHALMTNGTGLNGHNSAIQSSLTVPDPGNKNRYYVFTVDAQFGQGTGAGYHCMCLSYSLLDLSLSGGLGAVTATKNVFLFDTVPEGQAGTRHANKCDYWVVSHKYNTNKFYVYKVTAAGVQGPIINAVGPVHTAMNNYQEAMKFSPDGKRFAMVNRLDQSVELYDFDNATGTIYNPRSITGFGGIFGLEFSPNSQLLYIAMPNSPSVIWQFDVSLASAAAIKASAYNVINKMITYGMMQLAPDGKIYQTRSTQLELGVINNPNVKGAGCNYVDAGFTLAGKKNYLGLPNFLSSLWEPVSEPFTYTDTCLGQSTQFTIGNTDGVQTVDWSFGDGTSSATQNPFHVYSSPGTYTVKLYMHYICKTDSFSKTITIYPCGAMSATVTGTNTTCHNGSDGTATVTPVGGTGPYTYSWSPTGGTDSIATGLGSGSYTVTVTDANNDKATQSITITSPPALTLTVPPQQSICLGDSIKLNASASGGTPAYNYAWSHGEKDSSATVKPLTDTEYILEVSDKNGCKIKDTVMVKVAPGISALAGPNTTLCIGDSVQLNASGGSSYSWSPAAGLNDPTIANPIAKPSVSTSYTVTVSSGSCAPATAVVNINVVPNITASINPDTAICEGEKVSLTASGGSSYLWSPAATLSDPLSATVTASPVTTTSYSVTVTSGSCAPATNSVTITVNPKPATTISSSDTIQLGETITLSVSGGSSYNWTPNSGVQNPNSPSPAFSPTITTTYTVTITDSNGCKATELVTIFVKNECDDTDPFLPNAFSPNNDGINDNLELRIPNLECIVNYHLTIFNRWGEKVYDSTNPKEKWDGTFKDQPCNPAVFDYFLDIELTDGNIISRKGNVSLVR